jgi:hypothetical protein
MELVTMAITATTAVLSLATAAINLATTVTNRRVEQDNNQRRHKT